MVFKRVQANISPHITKQFPKTNSNSKLFYNLTNHNIQVLSLYRQLLKLSNQLQFQKYKDYCLQHIRNRFRYYKVERNQHRVYGLLKEGDHIKSILEKCITKDPSSLKYLDDLVWGRKGFLKEKLTHIKNHPNLGEKPHRMFQDMRSIQNKIRNRSESLKLNFDPTEFGLKNDFTKEPRLLNPPAKKVKLVRTNFGITFLKFIGRPIPHWFSAYINKKIYREVERRQALELLKQYREMADMEVEFEKSLGIKPDLDYLITTTEHIEKIRASIAKSYKLIKEKESIDIIQPDQYVRDINPRIKLHQKIWPKHVYEDLKRRYH